MSDVELRTPEGQLPLEVTVGTEDPPGLDISKLLAKTGHVTLDPGFVNTASCTSAITYIDGDAGILRYRGYPIEELAEKATFLEVAWLLIYGELPTTDQLNDFKAQIRKHTMLHEDFREFFGGFVDWIISTGVSLPCPCAIGVDAIQKAEPSATPTKSTSPVFRIPVDNLLLA